MQTDYEALKAELTTLLQRGHTLAVRWDCGNDESLLYVDLNGQELPFDYTHADHDLPVQLSYYLTDLLELPGVGAFELRGGGLITLQGTDLVLDYQSEFVDYDGDWAAELTEEQVAALNAGTATLPVDQELSGEYSGRQVLFQDA